ncbi:hypothetical protein D037_3892A, partial [Vibrio parahaemolyticus IDH02640]
MSGAS